MHADLDTSEHTEKDHDSEPNENLKKVVCTCIKSLLFFLFKLKIYKRKNYCAVLCAIHGDLISKLY